MIAAKDLCLYVLAGGQSRRFGSDKALARIDGSALVCDVIDSLAGSDQAFEATTLVTGKTPRYAALGYRVITDRPADVGPLGGLCAAFEDKLHTTGPGWLLLASCDLIRPKRQWIDTLCKHAEHETDLAVAYRSARWEPMPALYHTDVLPMVQSQLHAGVRSFQKLLERVQARRVALPIGLAGIPQANTPEQFQQALRDRGVA